MYTLKIVDEKQFKSVINMSDAIISVEKAYELFSTDKAGLFPVIIHEFEQGKNDMDIKSGHLAGAGFYGLKILGYNMDNPTYGRAALSGLIILMNIETQQPMGIVDASSVTFFRTGAAGAIGAKYLARKDSQTAVIVGAGSQGRSQLLGLSIALPNLKNVHYFDINFDSAKKVVKEEQHKYPNIKLRCHDMKDIESILSTTDVLVTCTTSRGYYIKSSWIRPGTHINAIGADMIGKQELEPELVARSKIFTDSINQSVNKGECQWAYSANLVKQENITEIGNVIANIKKGRVSENDITIFDATGIALQDLVTAKLALDKLSDNCTIIQMES